MRPLRLSVWLLKLSLGTALGLVLAEAAFQQRDQGAFPHVNFYEADAALGVRLQPRAQMQIAFGGNPVTTIHTNGQGFRGADWRAPGRSDVLVVGDSQVFGLGVQDDQTFSSQLAAAIGGKAQVLNAGVPTYGPPEYTALVEKLVAERKPEAVVYVLNLANDLFELQRDNRARHVVWDGWAVRSETAPASVVDFPYRRWLMSQSHAVFALRSLLHAPAGDDAGFASEGTWRELSNTAQATPAVQLPSDTQTRALLAARVTLSQELMQVQGQLHSHFEAGVRNDRRYRPAVKALSGYAGDPRDILLDRNAESARPVNETAYQLLYAALTLDANDGVLRELAQSTGDTRLLSLLQTRRELRTKLAEQSGDAPQHALLQGPLAEMLARTKRACDAVDARLLVVALPLDVQVSSAEWTKYGHPPMDLGPTKLLMDDIIARTQALGARALDATPALAAAQPGAFLDRDLHMSEKGHAALSRAIHAELYTPSSTPAPLSLGRSLLPAPDEWSAENVDPQLATGTQCEVKRVREWLRISCRNTDAWFAAPEVQLVSGGRGDAVTEEHYAYDDDLKRESALIVPVLEGDEVQARLLWPTEARPLAIRWPRAGKLTLVVGAATPGEAKPRTYQDLPAATDAQSSGSGYLDSRCLRDDTHAQPHAWKACALGSGLRPCAADEMAFGVLRRCVPRCAPDKPCASGLRCTLWTGERGCIAP